ncbi:MAG: SOS response-associated peptidase [Candidatus Omnitrophica bacterium]|nr:SOS response-associated peptidase [Candidatus Omnitrophota bacterium]
MCGRYTLRNTPDELTERFALSKLLFEVTPRYNIAPTQTVAAVVANGGRCLVGYRWGLVPFWAKDTKIGSQLINARAETLAQKPAFRRPFSRQRCLIPADGFYEWKKEGTLRQPIYYRLRDGRLFAFAGLWDEWNDPSGPRLRTVAIITVAANSLLAPVHDRMPAILRPEAEGRWLDVSLSAPQELLDLLKPFPSEEMMALPVTRRVNTPAFDDPLCVQPL